MKSRSDAYSLSPSLINSRKEPDFHQSVTTMKTFQKSTTPQSRFVGEDQAYSQTTYKRGDPSTDTYKRTSTQRDIMSMNKSIESRKLRNFENVIRGMTIYRQIENDSNVNDKSPQVSNINQG